MRTVGEMLEVIESEDWADFDAHLAKLKEVHQQLRMMDSPYDKDWIMLAGFAMNAFDNADGLRDRNSITDELHDIVNTCIGMAAGLAEEQSEWRESIQAK